MKNIRKAFSLVELMIVILIVAVLAIAVFVGGSAAITSSRVDLTLSDLHHFDIAAKSTLNESGYVASIENNDITSGSMMRNFIETFNEALPNEYRIKDIETPLTSSSGSGISIVADTSGKYVVYESQKTDAWSNPYYIIFDCGNRSVGSADFFVTTISAGPNGKSEIGGNIEYDDIFLIAESRNHIVNTETINCSETGEFVVAGSKWNLVATRQGDEITSESSKAKYASSGTGTGGGGGLAQTISATTQAQPATQFSQFVESHITANPVAVAYIDATTKTMYFDRVDSEEEVPEGAYTGFEEATYNSRPEVPWGSEAISVGVTKVKFLDVIQPVSTRQWFDSASGAFTALESIENLTYLDTSKVTTMCAMFQKCQNITSINVSGWNTAHVMDMSYLFSGCSMLEDVDTSRWNTSSVTTMCAMFQKCQSLTNIYASSWNTAHVTDMSYMFGGCYALDGIDTSGWNTSSVTTTYAMFNACINLKTVDVSNWDMSQVTTMMYMFYKCCDLESLDVSRWNTTSVVSTGMRYLFAYCAHIKEIDVSSWSVNRVDSLNNMFASCSSLEHIYGLENWDTSNISKVYWMFGGVDINSSDILYTKYPNWNSTFNKGHLKEIDGIKNWNTPKLTEMSYLFDGQLDLEEIDISGWNTSKVTRTYATFRDNRSLRTIYVSNLCDMSKITESQRMFANCNNIVGGNGTTYDNTLFDITYGCVDEAVYDEDGNYISGNKGYFTLKTE